MSDVRLRELERRWSESGDLSDGEVWLQAAVRAGQPPTLRLKVLYYGAGLAGKTSNLEGVCKLRREECTELTSLALSEGFRTLFSDYTPAEPVAGFPLTARLLTFPSTIELSEAEHELYFRDGSVVIFVIDAGPDRQVGNREAFERLQRFAPDIPWVLQFNKQDLEDALSPDELAMSFGPGGELPTVEASALLGDGVLATLDRALVHAIDARRGGRLAELLTEPFVSNAPPPRREPEGYGPLPKAVPPRRGWFARLFGR